MNRDRLNVAIQKIRDYTMHHRELCTAHHFLFDLPLDKQAGKPELVVMGINPGETEWDRQAYPGPTEETWNHDFHEKSALGRSRGSNHWRRNALFFANGKRVVFTELFFWSSRDKAEFNQRFGPLWNSRHLSFCVDQNRILIEEYKPDAVVFAGVSDSERVAGLFGLQHLCTLRAGSERLVEHYRNESRSWFFTKHWSGSFGFSDSQKQEIKNYIKNVVCG
jgi:hypothetical protein